MLGDLPPVHAVAPERHHDDVRRRDDPDQDDRPDRDREPVGDRPDDGERRDQDRALDPGLGRPHQPSPRTHSLAGLTQTQLGHGAEATAPSARVAQPYSEPMTVRVVFADDNFLVREGVAGLLDGGRRGRPLETVADADALHRAVAAHRPDAVLTDIRMPPTFTTEGIEAAKRIRASFPGTGVVVLSQYVEEDYAFELLSDGVAGLGYLLKERVTRDRRAGPRTARRGARRLRAGPEGGRGSARPEEPGGELGAAWAHRPGDRGAPRAGDRPEQRRDRRRPST